MIARWTSVDPLVEVNQETMSPFVYTYNNPVRYTDPDGRCPECTIVFTAGLEAGGAVTVGSGGTGAPVGAIIVGGAMIVAGTMLLGSYLGSNRTAINDTRLTNTRITVARDGIPKPQPILEGRKPAAPGSRPGKGFTPKGRETVIEDNKAKNNGNTVCENCGVQTTKPEQSKKGVTPPSTDTNVDHVDPKSNGGSGTPENGQVLCRGCNLEKRDKVPQQTPPSQQQSNNQ